MNSGYISNDSILEKEAILFCRYLLDRMPPRDMVERYMRANKELDIHVINDQDEHILSFSLSHPWSIPYLDAAAGLLMNDSILRKKIYVMAAVLEASPRYAKQFLPCYISPPGILMQLIGKGLLASFKICAGIPLFLALRRRVK